MQTTERFSNRVDDYRRYRPDYPEAAVALLQRECGLGEGTQVADIGAGTGIFSAQLLQTGCRVAAIEPNGPMRMAAQESLGQYRGFFCISSTAEATGLADASVDLITAAQSFHWCDPIACRREFQRILRPGGYVALLWNRRRIEEPFQRAYEQLLFRYASDYAKVRHQDIGQQAVAELFAPLTWHQASFEQVQWFDLDGLQGRLRSSSYCPEPGSEHYRLLMKGVEALFEQFAQQGQIAFYYDTCVYYGQLDHGG